MFLNAVCALIMALSPPFWLALMVYAIGDFGTTLWFPFYRSWIFKLIPKERASEFHAAITSYRRLIGLVTPFIAGALASVYATLPYAASLVLFLMMGGLFMKVRQESKDDESPKNKNSQH